MASCGSLLSEEQVLCSICLEAFNEPVSISCGHNFCKVCISNYWDTTDLCQCPLCKHKFYRRPELHVNTTLRDLVENVKTMKVRDEAKSPARPGVVPCDVCTGMKLKALKFCSVCQTSYCETHLEPHLRVKALKKHKLSHPVENLEDRMCKTHDRMLTLFCREDQMCVCVMCMKRDHKSHNAVPLEKECRQRKAGLRKITADIDQIMKTKWIKIREIKLSVETSKRNTEREISDSLEVFTAHVNSIQRRKDELIQAIEEKQKAAEKQAEDFVQDLEQEITELKRRRSELEKLSHTEDHLHLIQTFPSLSTPPHTTDWSQISVHSDLSGVRTVRTAVSQLEDMLNTKIEKLDEEFKLKRIQQQYAVDVTFDSDTAHPTLDLSEDGKQASLGFFPLYLARMVLSNFTSYVTMPSDNPERFNYCPAVLGKQSFSGRFYYEVQVEGKTDWALGVAKESINKKGRTQMSPEFGHWFILIDGNTLQYHAVVGTGHLSLLPLREKPQKVGVFVDYEEGQVSFYNVEAKSHIYSFAGCNFTENLCPFFFPGPNPPLIITPVTHTA